MRFQVYLAAAATLAIAACSDTNPTAVTTLAVAPSFSRGASNPTGDVYVMTNAAEGNEVIAFHRAANGSLQTPKRFATGGRGSGRPRVGSQGPVLLSDNGERLFVANIGTNDISVFGVTSSGLRLLSRTPSGGALPFSLALRGNLLYVMNEGSRGTASPANITAFTVSAAGGLAAIAGSTRPLSTEYPAPAQVSFTPDGASLVVTEKDTDIIDTYTLDASGLASGPTVHRSNGVTPFGFDFTAAGTLIVTEAFGGVDGEAAASSYSLAGGFRTLSASVKDTQAEVCWAVITRDDRHAFITNFKNGTISSYTINSDGTIRLLQAIAGRTAFGFGPRDQDLSADGEYLYVLDIGLTSAETQGVHAFRVGDDGSLTSLGQSRLPGFFPAVAGLASR